GRALHAPAGAVALDVVAAQRLGGARGVRRCVPPRVRRLVWVRSLVSGVQRPALLAVLHTALWRGLGGDPHRHVAHAAGAPGGPAELLPEGTATGAVGTRSDRSDPSPRRSTRTRGGATTRPGCCRGRDGFCRSVGGGDERGVCATTGALQL